MLEDNADRVTRFSAVVRTFSPVLPMRIWRDANLMIREVGPLLASASLISLDHDLESEPGMPDPGDGLSVVKYLVSQPVVIPTIIHTSNAERARWMAGDFDLAGWHYWQVAPVGNDWIESHWRRVVQSILSRGR